MLNPNRRATNQIVPGLCGAVHTSVVRLIRNELKNDEQNLKVVCVGDKSRLILQRMYGKNIILSCNEIGRLPPTFSDASKLADSILKSEHTFGSGQIVYNRFKSVVSYSTQTLPVFSLSAIKVRLLFLNKPPKSRKVIGDILK
jgi:F-type H+-transporting ATPase subunit gamma